MPTQSPMNNAKPYYWIPSLYFIQGLPAAIVLSLSVLFYKSVHVDNTLIALLTSFFYLPWILKPLFSPFIEIVSTKRFWLLIMQGFLIVCSLLMMLIVGLTHFLILSAMLFFVIALVSSIYDAAADGFYLLRLSLKDQAFYVGWRSLFYQLAIFVVMGLIVVLVGHFGKERSILSAWRYGFAILSLLLTFFALYHVVILPRGESSLHSQAGLQELFSQYSLIVKEFFLNSAVLWLLLFLVAFNGVEAQFMKIIPLFLMDGSSAGGLGLSLARVGFIYGAVGTAMLFFGVILSGVILSRFLLSKSLVWMTLLMCLANMSYLLLFLSHHAPTVLIYFCVILEKFCYGLANGAYMVVLLRAATGKQYQTTFYAFEASFMMLGMMIFGAVSGMIQTLLGYQLFFVWTSILSFVILFFTVLFVHCFVPRQMILNVWP